MAGGYMTPYQRGKVDGFYEHRETALATRLSEIVSDLAVAEPGKQADLWKSAHGVLKKTGADQMKVGKVMAERNLAALAQIAADLQSGKLKPAGKPAAGVVPPVAAATAAPQPAVVAAPSVGPMAMTDADVRSALKAFKKRLKVTKLDDESRIGNRPMTGGSRSGIVAISPPSQFPRSVWEELVKRGNLRSGGGGLYEFVRD